MIWLRLFTNKTFRKHRKLIFLHRDFIICIVLLAIFHRHLSSAFFYPHFTVRIFPSAFYHPQFSIRIFLSAIRHPPPSGPHFTETPRFQCYVPRRHLRASFDMLFERPFTDCEIGNFSDHKRKK